MTRLDNYVIAVAGFLALVVSAGLIGDGIAKAGPFTDNDQPNRWEIRQDLSDGYVMFDSAKGRICVVPTGPNNLQPIRCTLSPETY